MMRWINAFTLFVSGLLCTVAGYAKLGEARFAGTALVAGIGLIIWSVGIARTGEVKPNRMLPRIVANGWAWVFWYGVLAIVALKYSSTVANVLAREEAGEQGGQLELALRIPA